MPVREVEMNSVRVEGGWKVRLGIRKEGLFEQQRH